MCQPTRTICMLAYTYYAIDPRVRREAEALQQSGYQVDVICLRRVGEPARETDHGVRLIRVPMAGYRRSGSRRLVWGYALFMLFAALWLAWFAARRRYAVIQIHTLPDILILAAWPFKLAGARLLLDMHDTMPELYASRSGGRRGAVFQLLVVLERLSAAMADEVLVVHRRQGDILAQRGIPRCKMHVVMNSADERRFSPTLCQSSARRDREHFVVLYHGSLVERYGLDTLVRAAGIVAADLPALRVDIVGDGDYRSALEAMIDTLDVGHIVRLVGDVPHADMPMYIARADACVVPIHRDIFTDDILPAKLLEAVAMERPVIASRTTNIVRHFGNQALCYFTAGDPADLACCLYRVATDPGLRKRLVMEAAVQSARYTWSHTKGEYLEVLAGLCKPTADRPYVGVR